MSFPSRFKPNSIRGSKGGVDLRNEVGLCATAILKIMESFETVSHSPLLQFQINLLDTRDLNTPRLVSF